MDRQDLDGIWTVLASAAPAAGVVTSRRRATASRPGICWPASTARADGTCSSHCSPARPRGRTPRAAPFISRGIARGRDALPHGLLPAPGPASRVHPVLPRTGRVDRGRRLARPRGGSRVRPVARPLLRRRATWSAQRRSTDRTHRRAPRSRAPALPTARLRISGSGSDRSANCTTSAARPTPSR